MNSAAQFFLEGGPWMYLLLVLGMVAVPLALVAAVVKGKTVSLVSLSLLFAIAGLGGMAMALNRRGVDKAIANVNPDDAATIRAVGYAESMRPAQLGGAIALIGLPLAMIGVLRSLKRPAAAA